MKNLYYINIAALCLPFLVIILVLIDSSLFYFPFYAAGITGFIQIVLALVWLTKRESNKYLIIYLLLVLLFFSLMYLGIEDAWYLPLFLAIYFTIIIYIEVKKQTHESQHS